MGWSERWPLPPVVGEGLRILSVQRSGRGKHDGGVQVSDDPGDGAGGRDAGLGTTVTSLEGSQHMGHLQTGRQSVRQPVRQEDSQIGRQTGSQTINQSVRETIRETVSQTDRQTESQTDLLGDLAGAVYQLLLGDGVGGAALQSSGFAHQAGAAGTQLAHLLLDVRTNLKHTHTHTSVRTETLPCVASRASELANLLVLRR